MPKEVHREGPPPYVGGYGSWSQRVIRKASHFPMKPTNAPGNRLYAIHGFLTVFMKSAVSRGWLHQ